MQSWNHLNPEEEAGEKINLTNTNNATSPTDVNASFSTAGGVAIAKDLQIGGNLEIAGYTPYHSGNFDPSNYLPVTGTATNSQLLNGLDSTAFLRSNAPIISSTERTKLAGIAAGAEVNVRSDWNATSGDAQILNKPTLNFLPGNTPVIIPI